MDEFAFRDAHIARPGQKIRLSQIDTGFKGPYAKKKEGRKLLKSWRGELAKLQERLYAEDKHSLLVVLQATDTGGKDGTIRNVFGRVNPQGCVVTPFKVPTPEELAHDYLWRVHRAVPPRRMIGIFNRSHYEDVLVVRVHNLVPEDQWRQRYEQINQFEKHLTQNGVTILKFFLHISKEEQKLRLQSRLDNPDKRWKFSVGDLAERELWDAYQAAFEDMVNLTSTEWAPWYVIPADRKWYRNLAVARIVIDTLRDFHMEWPEPEEDLNGIEIPD